MIKPTIGRVVWFWPQLGKSFFAHGKQDTQPQAAIICWVHSDTVVNLAVFDANGKASSKTWVRLYQGDGDVGGRPEGGFCEWMPYQVGQAKLQQVTAGETKTAAGETKTAA